MAIVNLSGVSWSSISKVNGIAKASIPKVNGVSTIPPAPIQYADLNATKYATYINDENNFFSPSSFFITSNAISSDYSYSSSTSISATTLVGRFTSWNVARTNIEFDLSPYSAYNILDLKLYIDPTGITATASDTTFLVMGLGGYTFSFPTLNNNDYSLYKQYGENTIYGSENIDSIIPYEIGINDALSIANTYPINFSMALTTQYDQTSTAPPGSNSTYSVNFNRPILKITYQ
jgi:hypothetical protein